MSVPEQLGQWLARANEKSPALLIGGIIAVILAVDYFCVMQIQFATLRSLNPKIRELSQQLSEARNNVARLGQYQEELNRYDTDLSAMSDRILARAQVPLILESISSLAGQNGLKIVEIMPNTSVMESILKNDEGEYFSIPVRIEAQGGFHNVGRFLSEVEEEEGLLSVPEFVITGRANDQTNHSISLTIDVVVFEKAGA